MSMTTLTRVLLLCVGLVLLLGPALASANAHELDTQKQQEPRIIREAIDILNETKKPVPPLRRARLPRPARRLFSVRYPSAPLHVPHPAQRPQRLDAYGHAIPSDPMTPLPVPPLPDRAWQFEANPHAEPEMTLPHGEYPRDEFLQKEIDDLWTLHMHQHSQKVYDKFETVKRKAIFADNLKTISHQSFFHSGGFSSQAVFADMTPQEFRQMLGGLYKSKVILQDQYEADLKRFAHSDDYYMKLWKAFKKAKDEKEAAKFLTASVVKAKPTPKPKAITKPISKPFAKAAAAPKLNKSTVNAKLKNVVAKKANKAAQKLQALSTKAPKQALQKKPTKSAASGPVVTPLTKSPSPVGRKLLQSVDGCRSNANRPSVLAKPGVDSTTVPIPDVGHDLDIDWRQRGVLSPVKSQGMCKAAWAYSALAVVESLIAIQTNTEPRSLSVSTVITCDPLDGGCDKGHPGSAIQYLVFRGVATDQEVPLPLRLWNSGKNVPACNFKRQLKRGPVSSYEVIERDEAAIAKALQSGPLTAVVDASSWQFYDGKSIINTSSGCSSSRAEANHAVTIVGLGTLANNERYWIVRNSWSDLWGAQGYAFVAYGKNACGIANSVISAKIKKDILQYL